MQLAQGSFAFITETVPHWTRLLQHQWLILLEATEHPKFPEAVQIADNKPASADILLTMTQPKHPDSDVHKGAVEEETPRSAPERPYTQGQLGHRTSDPEIKQNDTDFPGPDPHEEHTGEREA